MIESRTRRNSVSAVTPAVQRRLGELENQLAELRRQVRGLQRLAALGTGAAMLAHEFNNLLAPIVGYGRHALQRGDQDLLRAAVEKTLDHAARLTTLCSRVLGLAADEDGDGGVDTPVRSLVTDALACLGRDLSKDRIEVELAVPDDLAVHVEPGALRQVLYNLIANARQAMIGRPGRLTIAARETGGGMVAVEVRDTGVGIAPENLERVFEPFFTTRSGSERNDAAGVGLGLSVCRQIMEEQGGDITASSVPGRGASFTLTVPAAAAPGT